MNKIESKTDIEELVNIEPSRIKETTVILNNDKPFFNKEDYSTLEGQPIYFELDEYQRSNGAIALISPNTLPLVTKKKLNYPEPSGWQTFFENNKLFEKCHIIAYSLSAKLANPNNIFIGTIKLNKSYMKKVENEVAKYIKDHSVRVLYKVTVKYKGTNQIPIGVLIEAQSLDDDFSICRFCYNIQKGTKFNYSDGTIVGSKNIFTKVVKKVTSKIKRTRKTNSKKTLINYTININTKKFHLFDLDCGQLKNVDLKNIQETTAKEKDLLKVGLQPCKRCMKNS